MGFQFQTQSKRPQPETGEMLLPILSLLLILIPLLVANLGFSHIRTLDSQIPSPASRTVTSSSNKKVLYLTVASNALKSEWVNEDSGTVAGVQKFQLALGPLKTLRAEIDANSDAVSAILIQASPYLPYQTLISVLERFQNIKDVPVVLLPGSRP